MEKFIGNFTFLNSKAAEYIEYTQRRKTIQHIVLHRIVIAVLDTQRCIHSNAYKFNDGEEK